MTGFLSHFERKLDGAEVQAAGRDPIGDRASLICACMFGIGLGGPVTATEIAAIPLMVVTLVRLWLGWRLPVFSLLQPTAILVLSFGAWSAISLLWTLDVKEGADHLGTLRWAWLLIALAPVRRYRRAILLAIVGGLLLGVAAQVVNWLGPTAGWYGAIWKRAADRHSGWWYPVTGGTLLSAGLGIAMGLAVASALWRARAAYLCGAAALLMGILASGTRGAWIAAAGVAVAGAIAGFVRARPRPRTVIVVGLVAVSAGALAWFAVGQSISARASAGIEEVRSAVENRDYSTDTGARVGMALAGIEQFRSRPLTGVGVGGFYEWNHRRLPDPDDTASDFSHMHAHNTLIHTAATLGLPGALLLIAILVSALRDTRRGSANGCLPIALGIVGLSIVSMFDTLTVSAQGCAMAMTLLAIARGNKAARDTHDTRSADSAGAP